MTSQSASSVTVGLSGVGIIVILLLFFLNDNVSECKRDPSRCRIGGLTRVLGPGPGPGSGFGSLVLLRLAAPQTSEPGGCWEEALVMMMMMASQLIEGKKYF